MSEFRWKPVRRTLAALAAGALIVCGCGGSAGASPSPSAQTQNKDDLISAAKKEGAVTWYGTLDTPEMTATAQKFMDKYPGIKVQQLRLTSSQLPTRVLTEQRGGQFNADVVSGDGFQFMQIKLQNGLQKYASPENANYQKGFYDPDGYWTNLYLITTVIAWNPDKVKADGLQPPASVNDLTKPEWKGKFAIDSGSYDWYAGIVNSMGSKGTALMKALAANKPVIRLGHTQIATQMESGEFGATATAYGTTIEVDKGKGKKADFVNPDPVITAVTPVGIARNAPHPNAARLFEDWLVSKEGQQYLVDTTARSSPRKDVKNNPHVYDPGKFHYYVVDPALARDYNKYVSEYKDIFGLQ